MAARAVGATVRAVSKKRMIPTRAPLVLLHLKKICTGGDIAFRVLCVFGVAFLTGESELGTGLGLIAGDQTQAAVNKIKELTQEQPDLLGLKIGVKTRGCNGLSYTLDYVKQKAKFDEEVLQDGVRVLIDSKAQLTLLGTEMDYEETKLESGFVFNNPNIKGTCGCGESFSV